MASEPQVLLETCGGVYKIHKNFIGYRNLTRYDQARVPARARQRGVEKPHRELHRRTVRQHRLLLEVGVGKVAGQKGGDAPILTALAQVPCKTVPVGHRDRLITTLFSNGRLPGVE